MNRVREYRGGPAVWLAGSLAQECRHPDAYTKLSVEGLVLELLAACGRAARNSDARVRPGWLKRVEELLAERFSENLPLSQIASEARVSADHMSRTFRRWHGCSIGEYVRRSRVDFACRRLMSAGSVPLIDVALEAGFADQSHFTKVFKRQLGVTPGALRGGTRR
jgi:AraC family transcriptional regulator